MLEQALIAYCAPTLARLKPGSLFALCCEDAASLSEELRALNALLAPKGLRLTALCRRPRQTLFYLYRPAELAQLLAREECA